MANHRLSLIVLRQRFAICRFPGDAEIPHWASGQFISITRTLDELSIVCAQAAVPDGIQCETGWRCLQVQGPLDFALIGVLASLLQPLAEAGVSVFAISTFDTDYILVKKTDLPAAVTALEKNGHHIIEP